jgi:hypothetical protein
VWLDTTVSVWSYTKVKFERTAPEAERIVQSAKGSGPVVADCPESLGAMGKPAGEPKVPSRQSSMGRSPTQKLVSSHTVQDHILFHQKHGSDICCSITISCQ